MTKKEVISGPRTAELWSLPTPVSWGIKAGNLIFLAGQVGTDKSGNVVGPTMREQYAQILENFKALMEDAGGSMNDIVRFVKYVTVPVDMGESYRDIDQVTREYYKDGYFPASTLIQVKGLMVPGSIIEVDAYAVL